MIFRFVRAILNLCSKLKKADETRFFDYSESFFLTKSVSDYFEKLPLFYFIFKNDNLFEKQSRSINSFSPGNYSTQP